MDLLTTKCPLCVKMVKSLKATIPHFHSLYFCENNPRCEALYDKVCSLFNLKECSKLYVKCGSKCEICMAKECFIIDNPKIISPSKIKQMCEDCAEFIKKQKREAKCTCSYGKMNREIVDLIEKFKRLNLDGMNSC